MLKHSFQPHQTWEIWSSFIIKGCFRPLVFYLIVRLDIWSHHIKSNQWIWLRNDWPACQLFLSPSLKSKKFVISHSINERGPLALCENNRLNIPPQWRKGIEGFGKELADLHPIISFSPSINYEKFVIPHTIKKHKALTLGTNNKRIYLFKDENELMDLIKNWMTYTQSLPPFP